VPNKAPLRHLPAAEAGTAHQEERLFVAGAHRVTNGGGDLRCDHISVEKGNLFAAIPRLDLEILFLCNGDWVRSTMPHMGGIDVLVVVPWI
jgi:hypothetical protein